MAAPRKRMPTISANARRQQADWWLKQHVELEEIIDELTEQSTHALAQHRLCLEQAEEIEEAAWLTSQYGMIVEVSHEVH